MRSNSRKMLDSIYNGIEGKYRAFQSYRSAKRRVRNMSNCENFRKEYKEIVKPYWKKYGVKPSIVWYQLWCSRKKEVDPQFIPDSLWYSKILPYYSNMQFRRALEDKNYHAVWFDDVKRPETVVRNVAGVFYDADYQIITRAAAVEKCLNYKNCLVKPSIDSGEGRLIRFFDREENLTAESVEKVFDEFGANFLVQQVIRQHPSLAQLNPDSINTIRVISFLYEGEVHILSSIVRIGKANSRVDNFGAGGTQCSILLGGQLADEAVNKKMEWGTVSMSGVPYAEIRVPSYDKIIDIIVEKHKKLAHFKLIGWDFSVDENEEPVFIEYNICPGTNQEEGIPTFGNLTDEVLDDVFIHRSLDTSKN